MTENTITETSHLREKLREATERANKLENVAHKASNDAKLYVRFLQQSDIDEELKE